MRRLMSFVTGNNRANSGGGGDGKNPVQDREVGTLRRRSSVDENTVLLTTGVAPVADYGDGLNGSPTSSNN